MGEPYLSTNLRGPVCPTCLGDPHSSWEFVRTYISCLFRGPHSSWKFERTCISYLFRRSLFGFMGVYKCFLSLRLFRFTTKITAPLISLAVKTDVTVCPSVKHNKTQVNNCWQKYNTLKASMNHVFIWSQYKYIYRSSTKCNTSNKRICIKNKNKKLHKNLKPVLFLQCIKMI